MNGREPFPGLVLRPVEAADGERIVANLLRSSRQTVYRRFHSPIVDPTPYVARFVANLDGHDHGALVVLDRDDVVAVAQWDRERECGTCAEVAITVEDPWQHRGLGRTLMRALAGDAHRHGITTLTASVLAENRPARSLASHLDPARVEFDGANTRYVFAIAS
jgi:GNAT superfamily N-acetyltransferase